MELFSKTDWLPEAACTTDGTDPRRHVLVVDDDASDRCRLKEILRKSGLTVTCAADGREALRVLESGSTPGIIISDWMMPGLSGLALCKEIRSLQCGHDAYFILVTGRVGRSDVETGLNAGADDFIAKPFRGPELAARVRAGQRAVHQRLRLRDRNVSLLAELAESRRLEEQAHSGMAAAAELQRRQSQLAKNAGDIEIAHFLETPEALAGDVTACMELDTETIAFYQLDVVGHGVSAALNSFAVSRMLASQRSLNNLLKCGDTVRRPADVVSELNDWFLNDENCDQYFTIVYGVINIASGQGHFCQAGHPFPILTTSDGNCRQLGRGGYPVGLIEDAKFEDTSFRLMPGSSLTLVTDGVLEMHDEHGEAFGGQRLVRHMERSRDKDADDSVSSLRQTLASWRGAEPLTDDVSALLIRRSAVGAP